MNKQQTNENQNFSFTYEFNAPKALVFNAFSTAEALNEWWGPVETVNSTIKLDFKPGGIFHFKMDYQGHASYGRFLFGQINPYDLLEFSNAFADENANVIKAPFEVNLPLEIFYRLTFTENDGKTTLTMTGEPLNGSDDEIAGFNSIADSMQEGFGATFDKLVVYLERVRG
jgi:uncharacterized protein YndB with AHSA1/START domain